MRTRSTELRRYQDRREDLERRRRKRGDLLSLQFHRLWWGLGICMCNRACVLLLENHCLKVISREWGFKWLREGLEELLLGTVSVFQGCHNGIPTSGRLGTTEFAALRSGGWESETGRCQHSQAPCETCPGGSFHLWWWPAVPSASWSTCLCCHMAPSVLRVSFPLLTRHQLLDQGPTLFQNDIISINYTCSNPISR